MARLTKTICFSLLGLIIFRLLFLPTAFLDRLTIIRCHFSAGKLIQLWQAFPFDILKTSYLRRKNTGFEQFFKTKRIYFDDIDLFYGPNFMFSAWEFCTKFCKNFVEKFFRRKILMNVLNIQLFSQNSRKDSFFDKCIILHCRD